jgi:tetratricopeptide (TPR) repeat protein
VLSAGVGVCACVQVPADACVNYAVELLACGEPAEPATMPLAARVQWLRGHKRRGNLLFHSGLFRRAASEYRASLRGFESVTDADATHCSEDKDEDIGKHLVSTLESSFGGHEPAALADASPHALRERRSDCKKDERSRGGKASRYVYVENLDYKTNKRMLTEHFDVYGECRVISGPGALGAAVLEFNKAEEAAEAIEELDATDFGCRRIEVRAAWPEEFEDMTSSPSAGGNNPCASPSSLLTSSASPLLPGLGSAGGLYRATSRPPSKDASELVIERKSELPAASSVHKLLAELRSLRLDCHSNLAAALLVLKQYDQAVLECDRALLLDPTHTKSLLRRGKLHSLRKDDAAAARDLDKVLALDPGSSQAARALKAVKARLAKQKQDELTLYGNMFASRPTTSRSSGKETGSVS